MPRKTGQAKPVGGIRVVKTWVLGFETVNRSVEAESFIAYFGHKVAGDVRLQCGGIGRFGGWKQTRVYQWRDRWLMHCV